MSMEVVGVKRIWIVVILALCILSGCGKKYAVTTVNLDDYTTAPTDPADARKHDYILNTGSKKFHYTWCPSVDQMKETNKQAFSGLREDVTSQGFEPCGSCNP